MGERYLVTGVQLGMIRAHLEANQKTEIINIIEEIIEDQWVGGSDNAIKNDAENLTNMNLFK